MAEPVTTVLQADISFIEYVIRHIKFLGRVIANFDRIQWDVIRPVIELALVSTVVGAATKLVQYRVMEKFYLTSWLTSTKAVLLGTLYMMYLLQLHYEIPRPWQFYAFYWMLAGYGIGKVAVAAAVEPSLQRGEQLRQASERDKKFEL